MYYHKYDSSCTVNVGCFPTEYLDEETGECKNCDSSCYTCSGAPETCTSCYTDY